MYYVYILKSSKDGSYYMGATSNLRDRLQEHNAGEGKYSSTKVPYILTWYCAFENKAKAYAFEKYLKSSSGFAFRNKHLV